jgi:hypothetical protein
MTLAECMRLHGLSGCSISEGYVVYPDKAFPSDLWHCSDFVVSSVSGGCVWLVGR